jgi:hypothetical protein
LEVHVFRKNPGAESPLERALGAARRFPAPLDAAAAPLPRLLFVVFTTALLFIWVATHG